MRRKCQINTLISLVSVNFGKNIPDSCAIFGCSNRMSTTSIQFYRIPLAKRYPERRMKWVTTMENGEKWLAQKINNAQICARFATNKPSQFSKA